MTNRALDVTDFLVLAEVTMAAALVIMLVAMSHESHSSWSPLPKNCPHFHLHYLNCQTWKLPHPLQQVSYNTPFLQQVVLIFSVRKKCTPFFWSTSAKSKPNHSVKYYKLQVHFPFSPLKRAELVKYSQNFILKALVEQWGCCTFNYIHTAGCAGFVKAWHWALVALSNSDELL